MDIVAHTKNVCLYIKSYFCKLLYETLFARVFLLLSCLDEMILGSCFAQDGGGRQKMWGSHSGEQPSLWFPTKSKGGHDFEIGHFRLSAPPIKRRNRRNPENSKFGSGGDPQFSSGESRLPQIFFTFHEWENKS